ncbi:Dps-like peroxide resistance protein Dpr [Streptococcus equi subsp. equi]|nr:Dps-like peroxide resistance protein Dpr [Streptococcus equi subsp. equi]
MTNTLVENIYASVTHNISKKEASKMKKPRLF